MVGKQMPGTITKQDCESYDFVIPAIEGWGLGICELFSTGVNFVCQYPGTNFFSYNVSKSFIDWSIV